MATWQSANGSELLPESPLKSGASVPDQRSLGVVDSLVLKPGASVSLVPLRFQPDCHSLHPSKKPFFEKIILSAYLHPIDSLTNVVHIINKKVR